MAALRLLPRRRGASRTCRWLAVAAICAGCTDNSTSQANGRTAELERVVASCVDAMVRSTCQVMSGPMAAQAASVVFVAGIGPVDADAYRQLRASGEAMCQVVRTACQTSWDAAQCKTARALWPAASPPQATAPAAR